MLVLEAGRANLNDDSISASSRPSAAHLPLFSRCRSAISNTFGHLSDKENPNEQGEREGDLEDDAVGEWMGSEDMGMTTETTA